MVKIVLDTNLLIAGRWNKKSSSYRILKMCVEGKLQAVYTKKIRDENLYILGKVKAPKDYMKLIEDFYRSGRKVAQPSGRITASVDDSDNRFLEAAVSGKADYVISNDHHLLDLKRFEDIEIMRPARFTKMLV